MLDASKASLKNSEDDALGRPLYLEELNAAEEAKFALYQMEKRGDSFGVLSEDDSEPGPSSSSKRPRTTKAKSKRGRAKTTDMSTQTKQDRVTRAQLRSMNVVRIISTFLLKYEANVTLSRPLKRLMLAQPNPNPAKIASRIRQKNILRSSEIS
jgi:hypothetical protein